MKTKYCLAALLSLSLVGCADLDTEPMGGTVTSEQKSEVYKNDPSKVLASVTAITSMFSVYMNCVSSHHLDFGYGSIMLSTDSRGIDMVSMESGYNWVNDGLEMIDRNTDNNQNLINWNTLYNQIYSANQVIGSLDVNSKDENIQFYDAQALAIRAFDYFTLAQLYQFTYVDSKDLPCVPLILDTNSDDIAVKGGAPRASVKDVYAQIMSDLNTAVELLGKSSVQRSDKRYVSLETALGLRARVNLVMQNWTDAAKDAQAVIDSKVATPLSISAASAPGFKSLTEPNWIWGISIAETDRVVTSEIVNWPSHMGSFNYGYASAGCWRMISQKLFDQINPTDARKGWFLDGDKQSTNLTDEQKSYALQKKFPAYTQVKFAPYDKLYTALNANDIPLMRIEEMYLILAEAQAMGGDPATGAKTLESFVQTYRDPSYTCTASTAADVQDAVWLQRRIELWGEGMSYFDLLRLKKGVDRRGAGFEDKYVFNVEPTHPYLIFRIPEDEIQSNKMLSDGDNNEAGAAPTPVE